MKNLKSFLALLLTLTMVLSMAACGGSSAGNDTTAAGNDNTTAAAGNEDTTAADDTTAASGLDWLNLGGVYPIVDEGVEKTLSICLPIEDEYMDTYEERFDYRFITEQMNIDLDVQAVPYSTWGEKLPLILADVKNWPDIIIGGGFATSDLVRYGAVEGIFLDLAPYITEEYMPCLASIFADYPDVAINLTDTEGHIYSLGAIDYTERPDGQQWHYLNYEWIEDCGLDPLTDLPETLDEFTELMRTFKEVKSAELGKEIYPISGMYTGWNSICRYLLVACGFVGYTNSEPFPGGGISMRNGEVTLPCADREAWEGFVKTLKLWYDEGLVHPEFFTGDSASLEALVSAGETGFTTVPPFIWLGMEIATWWGAPLLTSEWCEKPGIGKQLYANTIGQVVITTACEELELALAFIDFMYDRGSKPSEMNAMWMSMGAMEGSLEAELYPDEVWARDVGYGYESIVDTEKYVDANEMLKSEVGLWSHFLFGMLVPENENGMVQAVPDWLLENYAKYDGTGAASSEILDSQAFIDFPTYDVQNTSPRAFNMPYVVSPDEMLPVYVYFDSDTQERANELLVALKEYSTTETAKFIVGDRPIEELDAYFDEIEALGATEYVKIYADYFAALKG